MSTAILGLQWGDEGKGKITHLLARDAEMVVRFNGGPNAGHTVIDRGVKFGTHLIPAGAFYPNTLSLLAGGMVVDVRILRQEWEEISQHLGWRPDIGIDEKAHLILPYHRLLEDLEGTGSHFGTTRRGIAPAYADKAAKIGLRAGDLHRPGVAERVLSRRVEMLKRSWPTQEAIQALNPRQLLDEQIELAGPLLASVRSTSREILDALASDRALLFEGAQGTLLDVDHGSYPFVTSSATTFAGLGQAIGIPNPSVTRVLGVFKAYMTRVGAGPFPTRVEGEQGARLREIGGEFGVTTGRPRDCGWLDLVALRYAVQVNGCTGLVLTKLDVLSGLDQVPVCCAYRREEGGLTQEFPPAADRLDACVPEYTHLPGWRDPIAEVRSYDALPDEVRAYVEFIERAVHVPVEIVSVGPEPEATIMRA